MKKSRKRLLISSVAMLLVAMLALGTATFAWFTQTTQADANGIYAKAVKASNLLISKLPNDQGWASSINYEFGGASSIKTMYPASSTNGVNWVKADAALGTAFDADSDTLAYITTDQAQKGVVTVNDTNNKYVFKSMLNVKNAGDTAINSVTITTNFETAAGYDYVRMALVPTNAGGTTNENFGDHVYSKTATTYDALGGATAADDTAEITTITWQAVTVSQSMAPGATAYYNLYVWFEGQDETNFDANADKLISDLTFTVTGTPA